MTLDKNSHFWIGNVNRCPSTKYAIRGWTGNGAAAPGRRAFTVDRPARNRLILINHIVFKRFSRFPGNFGGPGSKACNGPDKNGKTMTNRMTIGLFALFFFLGLSKSLPAEENLKFVGIDKIEPMSWNAQGEARGFICDIVKEIGRIAGFKSEISLLPFKRALKTLQEGRTDGMISLHYKKGREAFALYPREPLYKTKFCIFVKEGKGFPFSGIKDLYGKRVGKMSGWFLGNEFDNAVKHGKIVLDETTLLESNIRKIVAGRIDAYLGTYFATSYEIKNLGLKDRIVALPDSIKEESVYMVISRNGNTIKDKTGFLKRLDAAVEFARDEGVMDRLTDKYIE
ncbi:MAG: transporter substrate-binding domain-containing protein [Desulfobacterales bacterium]|nr:transporter substrate-binding domain-containing protein [Desulfobacterales bacterium]